MNPCMPVWEHIADGEPRVFTDPVTKEERIYVFGSHDTSEQFFCSLEYTLWSAPTNDLSSWTNHGIIYQLNKSRPDAPFASAFAPDCVQGTDGRFYLYAFPVGEVTDNRNVLVSDRPAGPYHPVGRIDILGDPGVLVDDDGCVYMYNGGPGMETSTVSRLAPDMVTVLETKPMCMENMSPIPNFFEASSIRKIGGWYIYIYSSARKMDPAFFSRTIQGYTHGYALLEYCYSRHPMGPWRYGGILMNNGGEALGGCREYRNGTVRTYANGTIHGSIAEICGKWYVFYHRNTNNHDYSRQTCMEPIEININEDGVVISEGEMTSQGWEQDGLKTEGIYPAGIACYLLGDAYIDRQGKVTNLHNGCVVGYRYFCFSDSEDRSGKRKQYEIELTFEPGSGEAQVAVCLDNPDNEPEVLLPISSECRARISAEPGKHALYLLFYAQHRHETGSLKTISITPC